MYSIKYDKNELEMSAVIDIGDDRIIIGHHAMVNIDWAALAHACERSGAFKVHGGDVTITGTSKDVYFTINRHICRVSAAEFAPIAAAFARAVASMASATVWN